MCDVLSEFITKISSTFIAAFPPLNEYKKVKINTCVLDNLIISMKMIGRFVVRSLKKYLNYIDFF